MEDLPQEVFNSSKNVEFPNNKTGEITAGAYHVSITETVSDFQQKSARALLTINDDILGLFWKNQVFFLFDSDKKEEIGRMPAPSTADLVNLDSLPSLEIYIKSVYYTNHPMTLYFQVHFLEQRCTEDTKTTIKKALKTEREKRKYHHCKRNVIKVLKRKCK